MKAPHDLRVVAEPFLLANEVKLMAIIHAAERPFRACVKGGLLFGATEGVLVSGNLTSLSAAKAAVVTATNKLHVSQRLFGARVIPSLNAIGSLDSTYLTGTSVAKASMLAISEAGAGRTMAL